MLQHEAIAALLKSTPFNREAIEAAAQELDTGEAWGAFACAQLALRVLTQDLPRETFLSDVADATIVGVEVTETASVWRAIEAAASRTPYVMLWAGANKTLVECLACHLDRLATGWGSVTIQPTLETITYHEGPSIRVTLNLNAPTTYHPIRFTIVFGDPTAWLIGSETAKAQMSWPGLFSFVPILRHDYSPDYLDRNKLREDEIKASKWVDSLLASMAAEEAAEVTTWH